MFEMDKFEEAWKQNRHVWESTKNLAKAMYLSGQQSQQAKVEELQRRNQILNDNIKEQGQKLVYQNEVIETQAEKLLGLRDEKAELQKMVDLLEGKIKEALNTVYAMKGKADCDHLTDKEQSFVYGFGYELREILKEEQALKGGSDE